MNSIRVIPTMRCKEYDLHEKPHTANVWQGDIFILSGNCSMCMVVLINHQIRLTCATHNANFPIGSLELVAQSLEPIVEL